MTESQLEKKKFHPIVVPDEQAYRHLFDMANDVGVEDVYVKPNCKLCNSQFRFEAEDYCAKANWNYAQTERFLASKGEVIDHRLVRNHIEEHFRPQMRRIEVKHYCNDLSSYLRVRSDAVANLAMCRGVLQKELLELGSQASSLNHSERRRTADILNKLVAQLVAIDDAERKYTEDMRPINIVADKLIQIIQTEQQDASPDAQQKLKRVVSLFMDGLKDIEDKK